MPKISRRPPAGKGLVWDLLRGDARWFWRAWGALALALVARVYAHARTLARSHASRTRRRRVDMHPISFAFKRGHIRAVVNHRELLEDLDITPARFDALFYLRMKGGSAYQSEIWYELGLHPSTISRMIKSMAARGLVVREPVNYGDGRQRIVTLTRKGFGAVVEAIKRYIRHDFLRSYYANMHAKGVEGVNAVVEAMRNIGQWLQDTAKHFYSAVAPPDLDAEVRFDEEVKAEVDRAEDLRNTRAEGLRGLAAIRPEDHPFWDHYRTYEPNAALKRDDPAAWDEKLTRDWFHYWTLFGMAYPAGGFSL